MLDGLLGRGFASKCKSSIKMTKSRIEIIRRKRNATLKFLKKDMADLLANGLDINAYGRAEGLLAELTLSSCYDFVEKSCDFVLKHLSVMQRMRHCPEDCREAVSSLMFAAARFSDLPELRELRDIFYERYGNSVELFANQEFVENLSSKPSATEKKVQLMHDIASEFCIKWDSRSCEQRLSKPSLSAQDQPKIYGSPHVHDDKYKLINGKDTVPKGKQDFLLKERLKHDNDKHRLLNEKESNVSKRNELNPQFRHQIPSNGSKQTNVREEPMLKRDTHGSLFQGRQEVALEKCEPWKEDTLVKTVRLGSSSQRKRIESLDGGSKLHDGWENTVPQRDDQDNSSHGKPDVLPSYAGSSSKGDFRDSVAGNHHTVQYNAAKSARDVQEGAHKLNPYYNNAIPPPYIKHNAKLKDGKCESSIGSSISCSNGTAFPNDSSRDNRSYACSNGTAFPKDSSRDNRSYAGIRSQKILQEASHPDHERRSVGHTRESDNGHDNDNELQDEGISSNPIPKPRSSRRRHSKSHTSHDDVGNLEDVGVVKKRSKSRRDDSRRGLQILFDDEHYRNDKEERMIDKLLIHYSKKPSAYEPGKVRRKSKSRHANHQDNEEDKSPQHGSKDRPDETSEMFPPPRSISFPHEQTTPSEATKVFNRAASFQPDRSSPAKHVHPRLPDYDDLAAQFAALKGR
ncbi:hypothetical protein P3X46_019398 [Hevea brasiliensis]|uniref:IST1-like protein n=1 Tax=Hevea brasiliensis TaxID=3981 RepID=A0ABQ9LJZ1_HEVBR|nr:uncharacterized protein LOC110637336 [Hevea brasiliensis]KAJ9167805.1 hypothetical protein P3X46_019398 [Hevea brasiliensis]